MKQNKLLMNYEWYSTPVQYTTVQHSSLVQYTTVQHSSLVQYTTVQHSSLVQGGNKYINEQNKLLLEALFYCTVQLV